MMQGQTPKDWAVITAMPRDNNFLDIEYTVFKKWREVNYVEMGKLFVNFEHAREAVVELLSLETKWSP